MLHYSSYVTAVASAARTASGQSAGLTLPASASDLVLDVNVTAVSGTTPTMTLEVQWSPDNGTTWVSSDPADTFTAITASTRVSKTVKRKGDQYRIKWTIGGTTPSFTFAVRRALTG
jgi:hypothetical protein